MSFDENKDYVNYEQKYKGIKEFLDEIKSNPFKSWKNKSKSLNIETLVERWGENGTDYINYICLDLLEQDERHKHSSSMDTFTSGIIGLSSLEAFDFILENLPQIIETNYSDITLTGMLTMIQTDQTLSALEKLIHYTIRQTEKNIEIDLKGYYLSFEEFYNDLYNKNNKIKPKNISIAEENIKKVPAKLLTTEYIFKTPKESYDLYKLIFEKYVLESTKESRYKIFNNSILRLDEQLLEEPKGYIKILLGEEGIDKKPIGDLLYRFINTLPDTEKRLERIVKQYILLKNEMPSQARRLIEIGKLEFQDEITLNVYDDILNAIEKNKTTITTDRIEISKKIKFQHKGKEGKGHSEYIGTKVEAIKKLFSDLIKINSRELAYQSRIKINNILLEDWIKQKAENPTNRIEEEIKNTFQYLDITALLKDKVLTEDMKNDKLFEYLKEKKYFKIGLNDDYINAINRILISLEFINLEVNFDNVKIEQNKHPFCNIQTFANECTSIGGTFQKYGYQHNVDKNMGILALNLYENSEYVGTFGKAFLARCKDDKNKEILYIDGIVVWDDMVDIFKELHDEEGYWMPMYTKAIIQTALYRNLDEIIVNASHKKLQRTGWQYIKHFADLVGLKEQIDYENNINKNMQIKETITTSDKGFKLKNITNKDYYKLEKLQDENCKEDTLLEGFWINYHDRNSKETASKIPEFVEYIEREGNKPPQVNNGKGYVIGLRIKTKELEERFNEKYGNTI